MPEIISRKEARALGLKRFFTGLPCKRGHVCEGWTSGMSCIQCFQQTQRDRYYRDHDKNKKLLREYAAKNPEKARIRRRKWYWKNIEENRQTSRDCARRLYPRHKASKKIYAQQNREKIAAKQRKWVSNNPEKAKAAREKFLNPPNPKGEIQWLRKNREQLRSVKRLLKNLRHGQRPSPSSASTTPIDSPR